MAHARRWHLWSGIVGGLVAALVVSALPAVADTVSGLVGTQAVLEPGDPIQAGRVNEIDRTTWLRGTWPNPMLRLVNDGTGPVLELNTQPGVAPLAVDSKKLVQWLNVDRVDNRHANQMVRAAGARIANVDESIFAGDAATVLTATIDAPGPGLLVMGATIAAIGNNHDLYICRLRVDGATVTGTIQQSAVHWAEPLTETTANNDENCSTDGIEFVEPGTHTVDLFISARDTVNFNAATVWVLWVGFDGQGLKPAESSIVTLDAPTGDEPGRHVEDG